VDFEHIENFLLFFSLSNQRFSPILLHIATFFGSKKKKRFLTLKKADASEDVCVWAKNQRVLLCFDSTQIVIGS
jgi:hypothetical protein